MNRSNKFSNAGRTSHYEIGGKVIPGTEQFTTRDEALEFYGEEWVAAKEQAALGNNNSGKFWNFMSSLSSDVFGWLSSGDSDNQTPTIIVQNPATTKDKDNTALYFGIGGGVLVLILVLVLVLKK